MLNLRKLKSRKRRNKRSSLATDGAEVLEVRKLLTADFNDQFSEAMNVGAVTSTKSRSGSISPVTDVDMYKFTVRAGQKVRFNLSTRGGIRGRLRLFGTINRNRPPQQLTSRTGSFEYTFSRGGTYYLGVSESANNFYSGSTGRGDRFSPSSRTGSYTIQFSSSGDPNDQIREAINVGTVTTSTKSKRGLIDNGQDVDMYKFHVRAGQRVRFDIDNTTGGLDSYLRLFNSSGRQLARNDDGAGPGEVRRFDSYLEYTFTQSGTFFVGVSAYRNQSYNAVSGSGDQTAPSTGSYTLRVSEVVQADPDDQISEARDLGVIPTRGRLTRAGRIQTTTDVDMYRFRTLNGQRVTLSTSSPNTVLRVWVGGRELVGRTVRIAAGSARTVYVGVSSNVNRSYSPSTGLGDRVGPMSNYTLTATSSRR